MFGFVRVVKNLRRIGKTLLSVTGLGRRVVFSDASAGGPYDVGA